MVLDLFVGGVCEGLACLARDFTNASVRGGIPFAEWAVIPAAATASFSDLLNRYAGRHAEHYESRRAGKKWTSEERAVEQLLTHVSSGSSILDVPVGTGRFFSHFSARKFQAHGVDASADMLSQARANAERIGIRARLMKGDIVSLSYDDDSFDLVMCIRFLNLIDWHGVSSVLHELARVSRDKVMIGIRYYAPLSDIQRPADLLRLAVRLIGIPRYLAHRWRLIFHKKHSLDELLVSLGVEVLDSRYVERRWDGTDYVMLLLRKQTPD